MKEQLPILTPEQLQAENNLRGGQIYALLKDYQKDFLKQALKPGFEKYGCAIRIGGGKTFCAIAWINALFYSHKINNCVVFAPASKLDDWAKDLNGHLGNKVNQFVPMHVYKVKNIYDFRKIASNTLCNYVFLVSASLLSQAGLKTLLKDETFTKFLAKLGYVFDESSKVRSRHSNISLNLVSLNYYFDYGLLLSGSILSNGYEDTFIQGFLLNIDFSLDNHKPYDKNLTWKDYWSRFYSLYNIFNNTYIETKTQNIPITKNNKLMYSVKLNKIVGYNHTETLIKKLQHTMFMTDDVIPVMMLENGQLQYTYEHFNAYEEVITIPYENHFISTPANNFKQDLLWLFKAYQIPVFGVNAFMVAFSWCNGSIHLTPYLLENTQLKYYTKDEYIIGKSNKPAYLTQYLINHYKPNVIVFYNNNVELNQIKAVANNLHYNFFMINGQNRYQGLTRTDQMLIAVQYQSGAAGLNLQHLANYVIFYSPTTSCDNYIQAKGRIARIGQTKDCYFVNFITDGSVEEQVYQTLINRKNYMDATFDLEHQGQEPENKSEVRSDARIKAILIDEDKNESGDFDESLDDANPAI